MVAGADCLAGREDAAAAVGALTGEIAGSYSLADFAHAHDYVDADSRGRVLLRIPG